MVSVFTVFCISEISIVPFIAIRNILINKLRKAGNVLMTALATSFYYLDRVSGFETRC